MLIHIRSISDVMVRGGAEKESIEVPADRDLTLFLQGSFKQQGSSGYIGDILEYNFKDSGSKGAVISLDPIMKACGEDYRYTSEIALAFHHLLVSSLQSYVLRLRIVEKAVKTLPAVPDTKPPSAVVAAFGQLFLSTQLLFFVSHSRLFKTFLKSVQDTLPIPVESNVEFYNQEFAKVVTLWRTHHGHDKTLVEALTASQPRRPEPVQALDVKALTVVASASKEEESAAEDLDAEASDEVLLDCLPGPEPFTENATDVLCRRWIMGLVDHFASIRVLERVSRQLPPNAEINFSLLGLNRPSLVSDTWTEMADMIRTLCKDNILVSRAQASRESDKPLPPDFADKAISIIETKIKDYKTPAQSESTNKTSMRFEEMVYSFFKKLGLPKSLQFRGCGHCEAILMAIIHRISHKDDLDFSLKACSP